jgi:HEAT repeat protein
MGKQQHLLSALVVASLLAGLAWLVLRPHEPVCEGKPLTRWLLENLDRGTGTEHPKDTHRGKAIRALGTNALPTLIKMASTRYSTWTSILGELARVKEMAFLHLPPQQGKHEAAAWALKMLGPAARPAVPALIGLLSDRNAEVRLNAAQCLAGIGSVAQEAVPALLSSFVRSNGTNSEDAALRSATANALAEMGPNARVAVPQLAAAADEPEIALALLRIQGESLRPIFERLADTSDLAKWHRTVSLVVKLGTNAEPAIPFLIEALQVTNAAVQSQAITALGQIHLRPEVCIPALIAQLSSTNTFVRGPSARALAGFGSEAKTVVPELLRFLDDTDQRMRVTATNALRLIDPGAAARAGVK